MPTYAEPASPPLPPTGALPSSSPTSAAPGAMAPRGFATGSQQVQIVPASLAADHDRENNLRRGELSRRYREAMTGGDSPPSSPGSPGSPGSLASLRALGPDGVTKSGGGRMHTRSASPYADERAPLDKDRAELRKALEAAAGQARPALRVRSDYFGTAEHKALADCLMEIFSGRNPFAGEERKDVSHVLFKLKNPARPVEGALAIEDVRLLQSSEDWQGAVMGDITDVVINSVLTRALTIRDALTLHYGDIVALAGDYFADPESLRKDLTAGEVAAIAKVTPADPGTNWLTLHRPLEYLSLANSNTPHFTPWNWARYTRHHAEALLLALDLRFEEALVRNAFADHFLSDAFASGHLRTPRPRLNGLLQAKPMHDEDNEHGLWARNLEGYVWHCYGDDHLGDNPVHLGMTAVAVARSIQRVCRAYRLRGPDADKVRAIANDALGKVPLLPAEPQPDPRLTHALLGDLGLGWPSIRDWLPMALAPQAIPGGADFLCNFPPKFDWNGRKRSGPDPRFDDYFRFVPPRG